MNAKKFYLLIVIALVTGLIPQKNVYADMGPKQTMEFEFVQEISGDELRIVSGVLYDCDKPDCSDGQPVIEKGIQGASGFECTTQNCNAQWGGTYFQLEVTFSDGITRKSNIFEKSYFNAKYKVWIKPASLSVEELEGYDAWQDLGNLINFIVFCIAGTFSAPLLIGIPVMFFRQRRRKSNLKLATTLVVFYMWLFTMWGLLQNYRTFLLTLFIELVIALGYSLIWKMQVKKILWAVAVANIFSQPVFFFLVSRSFGATIVTAIGEIIVWLGEAMFVYMALQRQLSFKHILVLTFILNAASFGIGLLLPI